MVITDHQLSPIPTGPIREVLDDAGDGDCDIGLHGDYDGGLHDDH